MLPTVALAQSDPLPAGLLSVTGVERGSTALVADVDVPSLFLSFGPYGSEDVGPGIGGFALAMPDLFIEGSQLDAAFVFAGPFEGGSTELIGGGLGMRVRLPNDATTLFLRGDYSDV